MRALIALAVAVAALTVAVSAGASPQTRYCAYKSRDGKVMAVISNAGPTLCAAFNSAWHGRPFAGRFGTMRCAFSMDDRPLIILGIFTNDATYGRLYCRLVDANQTGWTRVK